mmetsp:Transcript_8964/g.37973  ORF Transcript_8964/g.37973 Transcript_8964/m.37973 type:complete len:532 (+) Transcript_8964:477-2072(+)
MALSRPAEPEAFSVSIRENASATHAARAHRGSHAVTSPPAPPTTTSSPCASQSSAVECRNVGVDSARGRTSQKVSPITSSAACVLGPALRAEGSTPRVGDVYERTALPPMTAAAPDARPEALRNAPLTPLISDKEPTRRPVAMSQTRTTPPRDAAKRTSSRADGTAIALTASFVLSFDRECFSTRASSRDEEHSEKASRRPSTRPYSAPYAYTPPSPHPTSAAGNPTRSPGFFVFPFGWRFVFLSFGRSVASADMSAKDVHVTRVSADPTSPGPGATLANSKVPSSDAKHVTLAPAHAPRTEAPSREKPRPTTFFFATNAPRRDHERDNRGGPVRRHVGGSETSSRVSSCFASSSSSFTPDGKTVSGEKASSFVSPGPLKKVASSSPRRDFSSPREGDPFVSSATAAGARTSSSATSSRPVSSPSSVFVFVSVAVRSFSKKGSSVASRVAASVARTSRARSAAPRSRAPVLFSRRAIHFSRAFFASRGGCGCAKSLLGALPNSWICASFALRCTGSLVASKSRAAPWYVRG